MKHEAAESRRHPESGASADDAGVSVGPVSGVQPVAQRLQAPHWAAGDDVHQVGCFYVRYEGGERWRCFNGLTTFEHVSLGTREEINENLERQSLLWGEKFGKPKKLTWRGNHLASKTKAE